MRIKSNPKRNIRLSELKDCQKGFLSISSVRAISGNKKFNFAINLNSLVYTVKSDSACIPVFGTGDNKLDFEIDLSSFIVDVVCEFKKLYTGEEYDWHKTKVDILDNVLPYDNSEHPDDEFFEDFYDDWLICSEYEKDSLLKEIKGFLKRDCDSSDVSDIVLDRKNVIKSMSFCNSNNAQDYFGDDDEMDSDNLDFRDNFYQYDSKEKQLLFELFEIKLDFINTYLLSSDNWQSLSKGTFLSIREYMIKKEQYEILVKPAKYFMSNTTKKI